MSTAWLINYRVRVFVISVMGGVAGVGMRTLILIVAAFVIFFAGFMAMFFFAHSSGAIVYPDHLNLQQFDWNGVSAIAAFFTFLINITLLLTVAVGFRSVQEGQASRTAQVLAWAAEQMDAVKSDEKRLREASSDFRLWGNEEKISAQRVANAYSRMCYYARQSLINPKHLRNLWGINVCLYWKILEGYIQEQRKEFGEAATLKTGAVHRADFEATAREFERHFDSQYPEMLKARYESLGRAGPAKDSAHPESAPPASSPALTPP
ncbi:hypothetical protein [Mesorhizobium sp. CAU 1732]|uniref:DUF4760 domain-containing protein n=1 Tax=Mesorhizobium sp. CAU 1732 TaxID=3140358 RepID=UPI0032609318